MKFFSTARNSNTATEKERGATPARRNLKNSGETVKELQKALRNLAEDYGSASKEQAEKSVLEVGAVLPQAFANVEGGERDPAVFLVVLHGLASTKLNLIPLVCRRAKSQFSPSPCWMNRYLLYHASILSCAEDRVRSVSRRGKALDVRRGYIHGYTCLQANPRHRILFLVGVNAAWQVGTRLISRWPSQILRESMQITTFS